MKKLHKKVLELKETVGQSPIHRSVAVEQPEAIRAANTSPKLTDSREIDQYFCLFNQVDDWGVRPRPGCFKQSLAERGPKSNANYKITVLWQHDQKDPLCLPTTLIEDEIGLRGTYSPDPVPSGDRCVIQVRSGTVNNGSYGFNYIWDRMEYNDELDCIDMFDCKLFEVSPVTIGSQKDTFVTRSASGLLVDEFLDEETEFLINQLPRKMHLEIRSLIARHISLAKAQPLETRQQAQTGEPEQRKIDLNYLLQKL